MGLKFSGKFGVAFLVVLNTVFLLLGLGMLIAGIIFKTNATIIKKELEPVLSEVNVGSFTLYSLADSAAIVMICVGVFITIVAALGCIGAVCRNKCLLVVYAIIVSIIVIIEIAGVVLWFQMKEWLTTEVKTQMKNLLDSNYKGNTDSTNPISVSFNLFFKSMECCGVNPVTLTDNDFNTATDWMANKAVGDQIPLWCCTASTADSIKAGDLDDPCTKTLIGNYESGCFDKVVSVVTTYSAAFIGIGITVIVVEILAVIFAFCICRQVGKDSVA